jgi:hypothetical protein
MKFDYTRSIKTIIQLLKSMKKGFNNG